MENTSTKCGSCGGPTIYNPKVYPGGSYCPSTTCPAGQAGLGTCSACGKERCLEDCVLDMMVGFENHHKEACHDRSHGHKAEEPKCDGDRPNNWFKTHDRSLSVCHPPATEGIPVATQLLTHLNERVYREFKKHGKTMTASEFAACVGAKMNDCVEDHLRQVAAQARGEGRIDGFEDGYAHANKSLGAVVRDRMAEADRSGFTRGVQASLEKVKERKDSGCLCPHEHGKDCHIWCRNMDAASDAIRGLLEKKG